ncbi:MAG: hypothetical protein K2L81_06115, partial [Muribaculaceae bacterium]|nr:hypothetical protein [Muribaculaceae bacterium]
MKERSSGYVTEEQGKKRQKDAIKGNFIRLLTIGSLRNVSVALRVIHLLFQFITNICILSCLGISYYRLGQSSCICVRLFWSQCNRIAPSLREHICTTLDRPSV